MLRGIIHLLLVFFIVVATSLSSTAQTSTWLKRSWDGMAHALGSNTDRYNLVLNIERIKNDNFDAILTTTPLSGEGKSFKTKVSGIIHDRYLLVSMPGWKVKCGNCTPQNLAFSIESGKLMLKGAASGCPLECTWIMVFSIDMAALDLKLQESLYALLGESPEQPAVAAATPVVKDTVRVAQQEPPVARLQLPPAGNVVPFLHQRPDLLHHEKNVALNRSPTLQLPEPAPERIAILKPDLTAVDKPVLFNSTGTQDITKTGTLVIAENPPPRVKVLPAGDVAGTGGDANISINGKDNNALQKGTSLKVTKKEPVVVAAKKDSAEALPEDYGSRKKNVIRTLTVNTDSVLLRVYDNGVVDGDIVSVVYNDKVVLDKLSLTSKAVEVRIPVNRTLINTLVFHAHNLGEFPPNTAKLEIIYGNKKEELTVSSDLTVSSTIDIVRQQ